MNARAQRRTDALRARYGPWALVTGASSGIGRALALELGRAGVHTVLVGRSAEALDAVEREVGRSGAQSRVVSVDLSSQPGVRAVLERTADLDVGLLVAAAGFGTSGPFATADPDDERSMLDVNCQAVLSLCLHLVPRLVERGHGGVVLLSSIVGFQGTPGAAHYAATKAYVQTLAEGLHHELRGSGVDVLSCAPGPVATAFFDRADMRLGPSVDAEQVATGALRALGRRTTVVPGALSKALSWSLAPLPRWGRIRVMRAVMGGMTAHQARPVTTGPPIAADVGAGERRRVSGGGVR